MNTFRNNKNFVDYLYVLIGNLLLAFAITSILKPNGLITGGITGISIIFDNIIGIKYTYIYYILSILVLISARIFLGKREALKIVFISISFPLILILFEQINIRFVENDMLLASIYFGIIGGVGSGLILKRGFSAGGTDTIAKILHRRIFPFISISQILLGIDTAIIVLSVFIFDRNTALYAILSQFVLMKSIDTVLFGLGSKKVKIEIISDENKKIEDYIISSVKRGVSAYDIKGGYTNSNKRKLVSICSPRESMLIKKFIAEVDSNAFVDVLPVISVWGKGLGFDSLIDEE
ncbi:YitT family protein [Oceanirhabdus seepicola]|uniref:YitT family protein n=1 Tax=Oceanirhabdus seepicola TaxID=2828781 RepID=A0A9J6PC82_9CLOT|nr:YitT family protein [Oceanirhabdus seepicola]MCM1992613.1 YitT family protein [Oceanirhabdus seepicola]